MMVDKQVKMTVLAGFLFLLAHSTFGESPGERNERMR